MAEPNERNIVHFGICDLCYGELSNRGDLLTETYLDCCVFHVHYKHAIPFTTLEDRYPLHILYILKQLEVEGYIRTHEDCQGVYVLPVIGGSKYNIPVYCSNRAHGCSKKTFLEHKSND